MERRVAIVGAGINGLLACKYAASKGFNPIVFEQQDNVGGLWNHTFETTMLQVPKVLYQFSDFPWPSSVEEMFPHNTQLSQYLQSYAQKFEILQYVNFNSKVINVDYVGESKEETLSWESGDGKAFGTKGKWILRVSHKGDDSIRNTKQSFWYSASEDSLGFLCFTRFAKLMVHKPGEGFFSSVAATLLTPLIINYYILIMHY